MAQRLRGRKPLLDAIEQQFEIYRKTTDEAERKGDLPHHRQPFLRSFQVCYPNEYDKLMAAIGSTGSNAYTWYDQTVYRGRHSFQPDRKLGEDSGRSF